MKKLLLSLMSLAIFIGMNGQKITNLTEATTAPSGSLLMVRQGTTGNLIKRITVDNLLLNYITSTDTAAMLSKYPRKLNAALTGVPTAPTAAPGTNTTQIATTAFATTADDLKLNVANPTAIGTLTTPILKVGNAASNTITSLDSISHVTGATDINFFDGPDTLNPRIPFSKRMNLYTALTQMGVKVFNPTYQLVYNALDVKPGLDTAYFQSDIVYSLDSIGYWDRIKLLYVTAQRSTVGAKINWVSPGTYNLTDPGVTNPVFTKYQGFTGAAGDYLTTSWNPRSDSVIVSGYIGTNSTTLATWQLTAAEGSYVTIGAANGGLSSSLWPHEDNKITYSINAASSSGSTDPGSSIGFSMGTRRGKTELEAYYNGSSLGTDNEASNSNLPNTAMFVLAYSNGGADAYNFPGIVSIALIMDDVTDTEATNIYNIFHRYMTRIGQ